MTNYVCCWLQALREEVQAKGPAVDGFLNRYRELTQHNPTLVDPVMRAVRDDWEELLGQIENLLEDKEQALQVCTTLLYLYRFVNYHSSSRKYSRHISSSVVSFLVYSVHEVD